MTQVELNNLYLGVKLTRIDTNETVEITEVKLSDTREDATGNYVIRFKCSDQPRKWYGTSSTDLESKYYSGEVKESNPDTDAVVLDELKAQYVGKWIKYIDERNHLSPLTKGWHQIDEIRVVDKSIHFRIQGLWWGDNSSGSLDRLTSHFFNCLDLRDTNPGAEDLPPNVLNAVGKWVKAVHDNLWYQIARVWRNTDGFIRFTLDGRLGSSWGTSRTELDSACLYCLDLRDTNPDAEPVAAEPVAAEPVAAEPAPPTPIPTEIMENVGKWIREVDTDNWVQIASIHRDRYNFITFRVIGHPATYNYGVSADQLESSNFDLSSVRDTNPAELPPAIDESEISDELINKYLGKWVRVTSADNTLPNHPVDSWVQIVAVRRYHNPPSQFHGAIEAQTCNTAGEFSKMYYGTRKDEWVSSYHDYNDLRSTNPTFNEASECQDTRPVLQECSQLVD